MVAFLCRLHLLIWSFLAVSPKRFTWLVECSILQKPTPSSSKDMKSWGKKNKLPQKRCVSVFLPSYGSFATRGPLQQRHDALLLPDKTSKAKKLHGLLQNATNALCLLLCLTFCLGQEQPMQYEIHSTCVLYTWRYCNSVFVINDS